MKRQILRLVLVLWAVFFLGNWARALTPVERTFDELVSRSEIVLVGTVTDLQSKWNADRTAIYTYVTLSDLEVVKGNMTDSEYVLRILGGTVNDVGMDIPGIPRFVQGEHYLLFIRGNNKDFFPIVGIQQGVFVIKWDANRHQKIVLTNERAPVMDVVGETLMKGKAGKELPPDALTVDEFIGYIKERTTPPGLGSTK